MVGRESLGGLIDDPGPCPVCDEYDCTHQFYGDQHYRIGDSRAKWLAATNPQEPVKPGRSTKGRRAKRRQEDRAHHPEADRATGT